MAANYLPSIDAIVIMPSTLQGTSTIQTPRSVAAAKGKPSAATAANGADSSADGRRPLQQGRTYPFHLSLQNPLYEAIQVRLVAQRPPTTGSSAFTTTSTLTPGSSARPKRPPFAVSLPTSSFGIAPFAEAWEYDDDEAEDEFDDDDIEDMLAGRSGADKDKASPSRNEGSGKGSIGVLEKKANITKVGGEVIIGRDGSGPVKVGRSSLCRHVAL